MADKPSKLMIPGININLQEHAEALRTWFQGKISSVVQSLQVNTATYVLNNGTKPVIKEREEK